MYIQCTEGFVEADAWDGQDVPIAAHMLAIEHAQRNWLDSGHSKSRGTNVVIVLRSRQLETLKNLLSGWDVKVFASPVEWDYQFRAYVSRGTWGKILAEIADNVDYRNFKAWCDRGNADDYNRRLAHRIWEAAVK